VLQQVFWYRKLGYQSFEGERRSAPWEAHLLWVSR